jgi:hypothetical protein
MSRKLAYSQRRVIANEKWASYIAALSFFQYLLIYFFLHSLHQVSMVKIGFIYCQHFRN